MACVTVKTCECTARALTACSGADRRRYALDEDDEFLVLEPDLGRCKAVHVWDEPLGDDGARALAGAMRRQSTLVSLVLENCEIEAEGVAALAEALKTDTTVFALNLDSNSAGDLGTVALAEAAASPGSKIESLSLAHNEIGEAGGQALLQLVKYISPPCRCRRPTADTPLPQLRPPHHERGATWQHGAPRHGGQPRAPTARAESPRAAHRGSPHPWSTRFGAKRLRTSRRTSRSRSGSSSPRSSRVTRLRMTLGTLRPIPTSSTHKMILHQNYLSWRERPPPRSPSLATCAPRISGSDAALPPARCRGRGHHGPAGSPGGAVTFFLRDWAVGNPDGRSNAAGRRGAERGQLNLIHPAPSTPRGAGGSERGGVHGLCGAAHTERPHPPFVHSHPHARRIPAHCAPPAPTGHAPRTSRPRRRFGAEGGSDATRLAGNVLRGRGRGLTETPGIISFAATTPGASFGGGGAREGERCLHRATAAARRRGRCAEVTLRLASPADGAADQPPVAASTRTSAPLELGVGRKSRKRPRLRMKVMTAPAPTASAPS